MFDLMCFLLLMPDLDEAKKGESYPISMFLLPATLIKMVEYLRLWAMSLALGLKLESRLRPPSFFSVCVPDFLRGMGLVSLDWSGDRALTLRVAGLCFATVFECCSILISSTLRWLISGSLVAFMPLPMRFFTGF